MPVIGRRARNLPAPRTSLIGRECDLAEVRGLLLHGQERLVTLTGVGGSGKTRLALQVASQLRESFPDGVWLVELAPISNPLLVPETVASALGIQEAPGDETLAVLTASLEPRSLLIILDNCEHVIDACANLVDRVLSSCPDLRILATSREPLQIAGEKQRRVLPLALPEYPNSSTPDELARSPAVQLFVERARAVQPSFQLTAENASSVARICTLLAGIPLALELAAARARVLSAGQIAQRLDDCFRLLAGSSRSAPTRQQTLKATLDWSYHLLTEPEQIVFQRLATFAGNCGLEAAEAVCEQEGLEGIEVLDLLTRLVDRSLVVVEEQAGEARYRLLEPVRQYGIRMLQESGKLEATRNRLKAFYVALAEQAEPELHGRDQAWWLRRIEDELDSIRAAVHWMQESGDVENIMRLAGALHWYFWMRRHLREGQRWLEEALAVDKAVQAEVRSKAMLAAALVCSFLGEYPRGSTHGRAALALYRQEGEAGGLASTAITLSHITLGQGDLQTARSLAEEGVTFARETGSPWLLGQALVVLGQVVHQQGNMARAVRLHEQALTHFREHGDIWGTRYAMTNLASLQQNRPDIIRATAVSSAQLYWEQRDHLSLAAALEYLAGRGETGHPEVQIWLLAAADSLRRTLGAPAPPGERDDIERYLEVARAEIGETRYAAIWADGSAVSLEKVIASVLKSDYPEFDYKPPASPKRGLGPSDALTRREREVARLLARGYTDRQIADELTITEGTAGIHVHHILEKLGFRSRVQVADWALAQGLIDALPD